MLEGQVVKRRRSGSQGSTAAAAWKRAPRGEEGSQEPEPSFGYKTFQGGRRTERTFISTHLVEAGWARVPGGGAKLGNEPPGQRQQTEAGSSAGRIADPYINLDFFLEKKSFKSSTSTT